MLKIGTSSVNKIFIGSDEVNKAYLGNTLVYSGGTPPVPPTPYKEMYLTFEIISGGTFGYSFWTNLNWEYTTDDGATWTTIPSFGAFSINVNAGDKIKMRGNESGGYGNNWFGWSTTTAKFNVYGNIMSIIDSVNFATMTTVPSDCFKQFFNNCTGLISAENLILPATTLAYNCYYYMFAGCTSLTTAPELPATTLAEYCYGQMFYGCTSLTTAPELPATTLTNRCYYYMFGNCTSLTTAPELPATTLANNCYNSMFYGCSSLNYIKCLATDISADSCTIGWVYGVASSGTFVKNASMSSWEIGTNGIPSGWTVQDAPVDYKDMYLTFKIISGGTISWRATTNSFTKTIYYKVNDGEWTPITSTTGGAILTFNDGDIAQFKGDGAISTSSSNPNRFRDGTIVFEVYGNIMSLIDSTGFATATTAADHSFRNLFAVQTGLISAENLVLPATTIGTNVYKEMFKGCKSLTKAPSTLPASTLAQSCYMAMFSGCTSLTTVPELPASGLAQECYRQMFVNCTSLTGATISIGTSASTVGVSGCSDMFKSCTSLIQAPEMPATAVTGYSYSSMFSGCTSLEVSPVLPATTLASYCYRYMFYGCSSLRSITCLATDTSAPNCTLNWVNGVSGSGIFYKDANMDGWSYGSSGIPIGWTVEDNT